MSKNDQPECPDIPWSHIWEVKDLKGPSLKLTMTPDPSIVPDIISFLSIDDISSLSCDLKMSRRSGQHIIHIHGHITATIQQTCVQSLDVFSTEIVEEFDAYFSDRDEAVPFSKAKKELFAKYGMDDTPILDEDEDPEPIVNGSIDLGVVCMQFLSLAIDPYPRKDMPKAQDPAEIATVTDKVPERENPFAALKDWHKNKDK